MFPEWIVSDTDSSEGREFPLPHPAGESRTYLDGDAFYTLFVHFLILYADYRLIYGIVSHLQILSCKTLFSVQTEIIRKDFLPSRPDLYLVQQCISFNRHVIEKLHKWILSEPWCTLWWKFFVLLPGGFSAGNLTCMPACMSQLWCAKRDFSEVFTLKGVLLGWEW